MARLQNFGLIREDTGKAVLKAIAVPKVPHDYILVRTVAIALNPTDWTTLDAKGENGSLVGCDYAGIVEEVGSSVTHVKKGDRVAGCAHGGNDANHENGAFARYIATKGALQLHIPDHIGFEEACTTAAGIATTGFALYKTLSLPLPGSKEASVDGEWIFIFGGSTASGSLAIQFAKLSGRKVVTTCSPRNFDLVKDRGADLVFDYREEDVGAKIRAATNDQLTEILDTVALESTVAICNAAMGAQGGVYCNLLGVECPRADIRSEFFLGYSMSGEAYIFEGEHYPAEPESANFAERFIPIAGKLWSERKWKAHPQRVGPEGLIGAIDGMQQMREGKYSGEKLVYRVDETRWP